MCLSTRIAIQQIAVGKGGESLSLMRDQDVPEKRRESVRA